MKYYLLMCLGLLAAPVNADRLKVVDDTGTVVGHYEMMWHIADSGYSRWQADSGYNRWQVGGGKVRDGFPKDADVIDVVVRADNYATEARRFAGDSLVALRTGNATITLHRGEEVHLKLNVPDGMDVPDDFLPEMYFPQFAGRVGAMWQPVNLLNRPSKPTCMIE